MSAPAAMVVRMLRALANWAYRSLLLTFLLISLLRLAFGDGGWFNEFAVALLLAAPLALRAAWRRHRNVARSS